MRLLSGTLLAAQQGTQSKPYCHVTINSIDYTAKLEYLQYTEQPYLGNANLIIDNHDRALDSVVMDGYECNVAFGHTTGVNVAEPNGDNAGNEYSYAPTLWVKEVSIISVEGSSLCQLFCEDAWAKMREIKVLGFGSAPYYVWTFSGFTVYELIRQIIEDVMGWTLNDLATSDGIVDVYEPEFTINQVQPQTAADILYSLISMTKCYLRNRSGKVWDIIYPQVADPPDRTFFSDAIPYFTEYQEKVKVLVPNSIAVFANNPTYYSDNTDWNPLTMLEGDASDINPRYGEILDVTLAPEITKQEDADARAQAILVKGLAEKDTGKLVIPHDNGMELYDNVRIGDARGR